MKDWPFDDAPNTAVITVRQILRENRPILYVSHDADDGGWQFLTGDLVAESDAKVVSLQYMWEIDPSLSDLADLPRGWIAEREDSEKPWNRWLR